MTKHMTVIYDAAGRPAVFGEGSTVETADRIATARWEKAKPGEKPGDVVRYVARGRNPYQYAGEQI